MLNIILNESKAVQDFKTEYIIPKGIKITDILKLLVKKYYQEVDKNQKEKLQKKQIYEWIMKDLKEMYKENFLYTKWNKTIRNIVNRQFKIKNMYNVELKLNDITELRISEKELKKISELNDLVLEKMAFIMLVYAKLSKIKMQSDKNEYWVNQSCTTICKEAKVGLRGKNQKRALNKLYKKKYIGLGNSIKRVTIKINYVDDEEIGKNDLIINNFGGVVHQYLIWKGEKWKECEVCGKWIRLKGTSPKKYCNKCSQEVIKKNDRYRKTLKNKGF